jgi:ANTAR domain
MRSVAGDLAKAAEELTRLRGLSPQKCVRRLVELVAQTVPGCAGATSTVWSCEELAYSAASHPDLAVLLDRQLARGSGPVLDAMRSGYPVASTDLLAELKARDGEERWPEYAEDALRAGVRCSATLVHRFDGLAVTLTLYGTKPNALGPAMFQASLLAAVGGISVASASRYDHSRRTTSQLQEAVTARAAVDQAKGLLMNAQGCHADEAFARLRQLSQTHHVKVTEIARRLIEHHSRITGSPQPAPDDAPAIPAAS